MNTDVIYSEAHLDLLNDGIVLQIPHKAIEQACNGMYRYRHHSSQVLPGVSPSRSTALAIITQRHHHDQNPRPRPVAVS